MRKQSPLNLWEVARGFSRRVPLMCLIQYESDIRPYLTALMIEAIRSAGETLQIPSDVVINMMSPEDYKAYKLKLATSEYN